MVLCHSMNAGWVVGTLRCGGNTQNSTCCNQIRHNFLHSAVGILDPWATWWNFHYLTFFLLSKYEVWVKVMFLHVSVILFIGMGVSDVTPCLAAWSNVPSRGSLVTCSFGGGGRSAYRGWTITPPELGKWAVHIPLECILVLFFYSEIISCSLFLCTWHLCNTNETLLLQMIQLWHALATIPLFVNCRLWSPIEWFI